MFFLVPPLSRQNGLAIRYLRIKSGMKPGELATASRLSYPALDNIENERKNASVEVLHRLAAVLGVPPAALVRDPAALLGKDAAPTEAVSA